jgi:cytochrome b subunit of formate dehydrogenase
MTAVFITFLLGMAVFVFGMVYATEIGTPHILWVTIPLTVLLLGISFAQIDHYTDQERCERSGFTWQLTDELVKSGDKYVYRGYCIDL